MYYSDCIIILPQSITVLQISLMQSPLKVTYAKYQPSVFLFENVTGALTSPVDVKMWPFRQTCILEVVFDDGKALKWMVF
jgi:hypothetical protein